jgi:hypothetical protein
MEPEHYRFGGGSSATVLHPLVLAAMLVAVILILWLPRKHVIVPVLLAIFLVAKGQVLVLAGVHFNVYRIILLAGLARWVISRRSSPLMGGFTSIDRVFMLWALSLFVVFSLQWRDPQAIIKATGDLLDALGGYFVLRFLIRDRKDALRAVRVFALIAVILGACMLNEQRTGQNIFGLLGGIRSAPEVRDGSIRSQGTFQHSITAGSFGATLVPLLVWLWSEKKSRKLAVLGLAGATIMTWTPHSSTTVFCFVGGIVGLCMWPLRRQMFLIRLGAVAAVLGLHLVMNGPVWSLLEHINLTGSSESYHRYQLIDTFIRHFGDWWFLGTRDNGRWGWEMADTSNQFVTWGINGGLVTFILSIVLISMCFGRVGTARRAALGRGSEQWFYWCLGACMFAHLVVFFGIDYFDQIQFSWYALIAIISMSASPVKASIVQPNPRGDRALQYETSAAGNLKGMATVD